MNSGEQTLINMSLAKGYNQWLLSQFSPFLKGDILEVGCGIGNFTPLLAKFGKVSAIDIEEEYIKRLSNISQKNFTVGLGNIENGQYFFKDRLFDTIICLNVLEHIKDDTRALANLYNLLKPGGCLILIVPAHSFLYGKIDSSIGHFRRYDKGNLIQLFQDAGFNVTKARKLNLLGAFGWFISGRIFKDHQVEKNKIKIFNKISSKILVLERFIEPPLGISILMIGQK